MIPCGLKVGVADSGWLGEAPLRFALPQTPTEVCLLYSSIAAGQIELPNSVSPNPALAPKMRTSEKCGKLRPTQKEAAKDGTQE